MRLALASFALWAWAADGQTALAPGARTERALAPGQTHAFELSVAEGRLVEARVTERGMHVELRLETPDGVVLLRDYERLEFVAAAPGSRRLVVGALPHEGPRGSYLLEVGQDRDPDERERARCAAAVLVQDGRRDLDLATEEATMRADGSFAEAHRLYLEAGDLEGQFDAVSMRGEVREGLGDPRGAWRRYEEALALARQAGKPLLEADALSWMGTSEGHLGELDPARAHVESALAIVRAHGDRRREGVLLHVLAFVHSQHAGSDLEAVLIDEALPLLAEYGRAEESQARHNLGVAYRRLGDGERAVRELRAALEVARRAADKRQIATVVNALGVTLSETLERPQEALPHLDQGLALRRAIGDRLGQGWSLDALGLAYARLGRMDEARARAQEALVIWQELDVPRGAGASRVMLGQTAFAQGDLALARREYEAALELGERAQSLAVTNRALRGLARTALAQDDLDGARTAAARAVSGIESARGAYGRTDLRAAYFSVVRPTYDLYLDILMRAGRSDEALRVSEASRARTLVDVLSGGSARLPEGPAAGAFADVQGLQRTLGPDTVLVEYALGEPRSFAWVVTGAGVTSVTLGARADIEAAARRFVELLSARSAARDAGPARQKRLAKADAALPGAARALAQRILEPLDLPPCRRLVVVADGALHYVPFAALPAAHAAEPLVRRHDVVMLPSASVVEAFRDRPATRSELEIALLADPVFRRDDPRVTGPAVVPRELAAHQRALLRSVQDVGLKSLPRLDFSRREAAAIAALVPKRSRLLLDFSASRETVTSPAVAAARVVHFATHGLFDSRQPDHSGLVLSLVDARGRAQDGFLRLPDIQDLKLSAELVVLSACQTALGKDVRGEGLVGLTRAFMLAGAPRVVASLWRVDDEGTAELMRRFYEGVFKRGQPPSTALAAAQRALAADPRWGAPYYWAAFTFNGDWR